MRKHRGLRTIHKELKKKIVPVQSGQADPLQNTPLFINQCAYCIDYATTKVTSHKGFDTFLGYQKEDITVDFIWSICHPDDYQQIAELTVRVLKWCTAFPHLPFSNVFSLNYRIRKANGEYIRILRQTATSEIDASGKIRASFSVCTDISHLQLDDTISVRLLGGNAEIVDLKYMTKNDQVDGVVRLSPREMDILALIAQGKTSDEIGQSLNISVNTVTTHRRNMLARTGFTKFTHLIRHVIGEGLI